MAKYELMAVFSSQADEYKRQLGKVGELLEQAQLTVDKTDDIGEQQLAYPIHKEKRGHYYLYKLSAESPDAVKNLRNSLSLQEPPALMRYHIVRAADEK